MVTYRDHKIEADRIEYDTETGDITAIGHLKLTGGSNNENISASHATMNLQTQTGHLYDVTGSVGIKRTASATRSIRTATRFYLRVTWWW